MYVFETPPDIGQFAHIIQGTRTMNQSWRMNYDKTNTVKPLI